MKIKYIAYYRVSTQKQEHGLSAQKNMVENYINSTNGNLLKSFEEKEMNDRACAAADCG